MLIERVTLVTPTGTGDRAPITLTDVTLRSIDRSRQMAVLEVPTDAFEETSLAAHANAEAGSAIVFTIIEGQTYSGYIEVIAESTDSRFYWCGIAV